MSNPQARYDELRETAQDRPWMQDRFGARNRADAQRRSTA